jgi:hypothetical protein
MKKRQDTDNNRHRFSPTCRLSLDETRISPTNTFAMRVQPSCTVLTVIACKPSFTVHNRMKTRCALSTEHAARAGTVGKFQATRGIQAL